jgi:hypothetical protein
MHTSLTPQNGDFEAPFNAPIVLVSERPSSHEDECRQAVATGKSDGKSLPILDRLAASAADFRTRRRRSTAARNSREKPR